MKAYLSFYPVVGVMTLLLLSVFVEAGGWCYQEFADQSTACGGVVTTTGNYSNPGNWSDGNWNTADNIVDCVAFIGYVNYTKPTGASDAKWQVKDSEGTYNLTPNWGAYGDRIAVQIYYRPCGSAPVGIYWKTDSNGGTPAWTSHRYDDQPPLNDKIPYEEGMWWFIETAPTIPTGLTALPATLYVGNTLTGSASGSTDAEGDGITYYYEFYNLNDATTKQAYSTTSTYTLQQSDAHNKIRVRAKAYDGTLYSGEKEANSSTLSNTIPVLGLPSIDLVAPHTNDTLTCNAGSYSDADGDSEVAASRQWLWFKNHLTTDIVTQTFKILGNATFNDNMTCQERTHDGTAYSNYVNSTTTQILYLVNVTGAVTNDVLSYNDMVSEEISCKRDPKIGITINEGVVRTITFANVSFTYSFTPSSPIPFNISGFEFSFNWNASGASLDKYYVNLTYANGTNILQASSLNISLANYSLGNYYLIIWANISNGVVSTQTESWAITDQYLPVFNDLAISSPPYYNSYVMNAYVNASDTETNISGVKFNLRDQNNVNYPGLISTLIGGKWTLRYSPSTNGVWTIYGVEIRDGYNNLLNVTTSTTFTVEPVPAVGGGGGSTSTIIMMNNATIENVTFTTSPKPPIDVYFVTLPSDQHIQTRKFIVRSNRVLSGCMASVPDARCSVFNETFVQLAMDFDIDTDTELSSVKTSWIRLTGTSGEVMDLSYTVRAFNLGGYYRSRDLSFIPAWMRTTLLFKLNDGLVEGVRYITFIIPILLVIMLYSIVDWWRKAIGAEGGL